MPGPVSRTVNLIRVGDCSTATMSTDPRPVNFRALVGRFKSTRRSARAWPSRRSVVGTGTPTGGPFSGGGPTRPAGAWAGGGRRSGGALKGRRGGGGTGGDASDQEGGGSNGRTPSGGGGTRGGGGGWGGSRERGNRRSTASP